MSRSRAAARDLGQPTCPHPTDQLTARDVILEIVHNMREGIEPLLYSSLAPAVYHVFLHPDDYERLQPDRVPHRRRGQPRARRGGATPERAATG